MTPLLWSVSSSAMALAGAGLALRLRSQLQWLTSLSAGLLVAVAMVNMLPESFALQHALEPSDSGHHTILYVTGLGFLLFYALDLMVPEQHAHGHEHHRHAPEVPRVVGLIGAVILSLHRLVDGAIIVAASSAPEPVLGSIGAALVAHNFADGLSSASIMLRDGHSLRRTLAVSAVVALCPLFGVLVGGLVTLPPQHVSYALALFAGAFLYLGGSHLLIREHGAGLKFAPLAAAAGFLLVYLLQR